MLFSVIIPVYNGENALKKCLDSIAAQTFQDYQVLIVDDGSTDGSATVAKQYIQRDERFVLISMEHGGPGAARNKGLLRAEGDYILHMDADDYWMGENVLRELAQRIQVSEAEVYMYQSVKVTEDGTVLKRYAKPPFAKADVVLDLKEVYQDLVADGQTLAAAWNKCVSRALLLEKNIRFRENVRGEDIDWVLQLFSYVQTICLLNLYVYAYTQHKYASRSTDKDAPDDLASIVSDWAARLAQGEIAHKEAVAGLTAFEYGICMGNHHLLSGEKKALMRKNVHLLQHGLDRKTKLIYRFYRVFGYGLTSLAIRLYLHLRRIW